MADKTNTFYAAAAIHGYGAQWLIGEAPPVIGQEVFEAVANVKRITPGDMSTAVIDKTHLRSPDAHREKKAGLRDSGPFAIELIWDPTHESHSAVGGGSGNFTTGGVFAMWRLREERNMKIRLADGSPGTEWPFKGVITKCQIGEIGEDNIIPLMVEVTPLQAYDASLP